MPKTNQNSNTTDATPNVADQTPTVVVQISADQLKRAVHDSIVEMQKNAVASSKSAIVGLLTLPVKATGDWLHWWRYGDVGGSRGFGKPKVWPAPGETAEQAFNRVYGEPQQA